MSTSTATVTKRPLRCGLRSRIPSDAILLFTRYAAAAHWHRRRDCRTLNSNAKNTKKPKTRAFYCFVVRVPSTALRPRRVGRFGLFSSDNTAAENLSAPSFAVSFSFTCALSNPASRETNPAGPSLSELQLLFSSGTHHGRLYRGKSLECVVGNRTIFVRQPIDIKYQITIVSTVWRI